MNVVEEVRMWLAKETERQIVTLIFYFVKCKNAGVIGGKYGGEPMIRPLMDQIQP